MKKRIVVGTRGSKLALIQAGYVVAGLKKAEPQLEIEIREIKTAGDRDGSSRLESLGVSVFVKELEEALREKRIDLAVHSLKDMPADLPEGFCLAAVTERMDVRDVLVSKKGGLGELPDGALIGTGSLRRMIQLKCLRPGLQAKQIRGNIDTRLRKVSGGEYDGVILAAAAMLRLGLEDEITEYLPLDPFLPAAGQGALAVETRSGDAGIIEMASSMNNQAAFQAVTAERAFLRATGGGCHAPVAVLGTVSGGLLKLEGMVAGVASHKVLRASAEGDVAAAESTGLELAEQMRLMGAGELASEVADE